MSSSYHALSRKQLVWTIIGLQLTLLLAAIDNTIVGTAMPRIIEDLHGFERYAWTTTAYLLTSTTIVPIIGKLSDLYGRKWFFLGGAIFFVLTSALCGAAGDLPLPLDGMNQLILFRGLQGIGGGIITALTFIVVGDLFPPAERGKYQGLFTAVWGVASVFGPTLGGWITDQLSWRWVFYVNLPIGLIAAIVLYFSFPHIVPQKNQKVKRKIDYWGVITLVGCIVPLLLALTWAGDPLYGWGTGRVIITMVIAAVMLVAFLMIEQRAEEPILPLKLFRMPVIGVSMTAMFLTGVGMFATILFAPLFMQGVLGVSATESGTLLTPMMLTFVAGSIFSGQLMSRTGKYKVLAFFGLGSMAVGTFMLSNAGTDATRAQMLWSTVIIGFGAGMTGPLYTLVVQNAVPPMMIGVATAATQFFRSMGATLGTAVFGTIMLKQYSSHFIQTVPPGISDEMRNVFTNPLQLIHQLPILRESYSHVPNGPEQLENLLRIMRESLQIGLTDVFLIAAIVIAIAFGVTIFLKEIPLRRAHHTPDLQDVSTPAAPPVSQPPYAQSVRNASDRP